MTVFPAQAGIPPLRRQASWTPASAGVTERVCNINNLHPSVIPAKAGTQLNR